MKLFCFITLWKHTDFYFIC